LKLKLLVAWSKHGQLQCGFSVSPGMPHERVSHQRLGVANAGCWLEGWYLPSSQRLLPHTPGPPSVSPPKSLALCCTSGLLLPQSPTMLVSRRLKSRSCAGSCRPRALRRDRQQQLCSWADLLTVKSYPAVRMDQCWATEKTPLFSVSNSPGAFMTSFFLLPR